MNTEYILGICGVYFFCGLFTSMFYGLNTTHDGREVFSAGFIWPLLWAKHLAIGIYNVLRD